MYVQLKLHSAAMHTGLRGLQCVHPIHRTRDGKDAECGRVNVVENSMCSERKRDRCARPWLRLLMYMLWMKRKWKHFPIACMCVCGVCFECTCVWHGNLYNIDQHSIVEVSHRRGKVVAQGKIRAIKCTKANTKDEQTKCAEREIEWEREGGERIRMTIW